MLVPLIVAIVAVIPIVTGTPAPSLPSADRALQAADAVLGGQAGARVWLVRGSRGITTYRRLEDVPAADDTFVVARENERVLAVAHLSTSESGDWVNIYTHVFDPAGRTLVFRRESGFFNGECPDTRPGPLHETEIITFGPGSTSTRSTVLYDGEGIPFSGAGCVFYHRHAYKPSRTLKAFASSQNLSPWLP